jgi:hypothetical protein
LDILVVSGQQAFIVLIKCNMPVILGAELPLNCLCLHISSYFLPISPSPLSLSLRCELLCCLGSEFRRGAGVLDIVYESPVQLLTCGYDTYIRSWDLRLSPRYTVNQSAVSQLVHILSCQSIILFVFMYKLSKCRFRSSIMIGREAF